eukprot:TRINITY_DN11879_c0_g1_i1.p1 TRINITY_DN11879_c0_g1~~TRINITY_DN11879_c0_g1_i1.p1  ORF type:complete len:214 (+),score=54.90 TRINITY_DN11879_c0_g1_i1:34-642(+)
MAIHPRFAAHRLGSSSAPVVIEAFLDYTCPFSARFFNRYVKEVQPWAEEAFPGKLQFIFRHQIQPWHPQSTLVHEAALAVERLSPEKFYAYSQRLFDNIEKFYDDQTYEKTRSQIYRDLAELAQEVGVDASQVLALLQYKAAEGQHNNGNEITNDLKLFIRYGRQQSIHVSPTVTVNGLIDNNISSGWPLEEWQKLLKPLLE